MCIKHCDYRFSGYFDKWNDSWPTCETVNDCERVDKSMARREWSHDVKMNMLEARVRCQELPKRPAKFVERLELVSTRVEIGLVPC